MPRDTIKCSQCDKTFPSGYEYRMHWEEHLDEFLKQKNIINYEQNKTSRIRTCTKTACRI